MMRNWINISIGKLLSEGAKEKAYPMFSLVPDEIIEKNKKLIDDTIDVFKGNTQRLTWIIKILRLQLVENHPNKEEVADAILVYSDGVDTSDQITPNLLSRFIHFYQLPIPEMKKYKYTNQNISKVLSDFSVLEEEFKKAADQEVELLGNEDIIMDFKDGFVWMNLNRGGCDQEAKAMGHCGNGEGGDNETILSLRKHIRGNIYRPSLTFVLEDGYLTEMKGRQNNKPHKKYHKYIVPLLRNLTTIRGIKGGGYLPENNFSLADLDVSVLTDVIKDRPELLDIETAVMLNKRGNDDVQDFLEEKLPVESIDWGTNIITFHGGMHVDSIINSYFHTMITEYGFERAIVEKCDEYNKLNYNRPLSSDMIVSHYKDLLNQAQKILIPYTMFNMIDDVRYEETSEDIFSPRVKLSQIIEQSDSDDGDKYGDELIIDRIDRVEPFYDQGDIKDIIYNYDDFDNIIIKKLFDRNATKDDVVEMLFQKYLDEEFPKYENGHTIKDPNQLSFDLK